MQDTLTTPWIHVMATGCLDVDCGSGGFRSSGRQLLLSVATSGSVSGRLVALRAGAPRAHSWSAGSCRRRRVWIHAGRRERGRDALPEAEEREVREARLHNTE